MRRAVSLVLALSTALSLPATAWAAEPPATAESPTIVEPLPFIRLPAPVPEPEPPTGDGLITGGGLLLGASVLLTAIGAPLMVGGALSEGPASPGSGLAAPLLGLGAASLVAGIPMLSVGLVRRSAWRRWEHRRRVSLRPDLRHRAGSTSLGLVLRF